MKILTITGLSLLAIQEGGSHAAASGRGIRCSGFLEYASDIVTD